MTEFKKELIEIAKEYKLPFSIVERAFNSQFEFTRETIEELVIKGINKEELTALKTNFNYKYIGKLYAASKLLNKYKKGEDEFQTKSKLSSDDSSLDTKGEE